MNRQILALIIVVLVGITSTILYFGFPEPKGETLDVQNQGNKILEEVSKIKENEEKVGSWAADLGIEDVGHLEEHNHDFVNHYNHPKSMMEYLFGTLLVGDKDLFATAFYFETLAEDLNQARTPDETMELLGEIMNRISRNNTLVDVEFVSSKINSNKSAVATVILVYQDEKRISLDIELLHQHSYHDHDSNAYFVSTSVWDMIEEIEKE